MCIVLVSSHLIMDSSSNKSAPLKRKNAALPKAAKSSVVAKKAKVVSPGKGVKKHAKKVNVVKRKSPVNAGVSAVNNTKQVDGNDMASLLSDGDLEQIVDRVTVSISSKLDNLSS